MSEFDCSPSDVLLVADQIARRMAHKWAHRKGFGQGVAEDVLDDALPILWAQRVERVPLDMGELYAKALALVSVQKGRKIQYDKTVLERKAIAWWSVLRSPRSQFVGDDGSDAEYVPCDLLDNPLFSPHFENARRLVARAIGYDDLSHLNAYHA